MNNFQQEIPNHVRGVNKMYLSKNEYDYIRNILVKFKREHVNPNRMFFEILGYNDYDRDVTLLISGYNCDCKGLYFGREFIEDLLSGNPELEAGKLIREHLKEFNINKTIEERLPLVGEEYGPDPRVGLRNLIMEDVEYFNVLISMIDKIENKQNGNGA